MNAAPRPTAQAAPALPRDHDAAIYELGHIAALLRALTDEAGPIGPEVAGAMSFLAYLASE